MRSFVNVMVMVVLQDMLPGMEKLMMMVIVLLNMWWLRMAMVMRYLEIFKE